MSKAQVSCKVPSVRPRRGIIAVRWRSSFFILGARNQSGRTWEGGSRASKVPTQTQVGPEGTWHTCKPPAKTGLGREADVDTNVPGATPAKPGCGQPLVKLEQEMCPTCVYFHFKNSFFFLPLVFL